MGEKVETQNNVSVIVEIQSETMDDIFDNIKEEEIENRSN